MEHQSAMRARAGASALSGLVMAALLLTGPAAPAALADATIGTTTTLSGASLDPKPAGRTATVTATVTPSSGTDMPTGTVTLYKDDAGTRTKLDEQPVTGGQAALTLAADLADGTYHLVASYGGDATFLTSDSAQVTVVVGPRPTATTVSISGPHDGSGATAQKGDLITVTVDVQDTGTSGNVALAGDVTIEVDGANKGTAGTANGKLALSTATWALGSHTVKATYEGGGTDHSSSNASTSITIVSNVVEASGVGVQYATFYPYKDGYRDTVAIRGNRGEQISVAIRIYSPTGKVVRTFTVVPGTGGYSVAWNGRNAAGTALPAGKYKVVQTLKDSLGATKVVPSYVTRSNKRLYTYSQTFTKSYSQAARSTATWIAWSFTLPSATVYKRLVVSIYGKDSNGSGGFGPHDFTYCPSSTWHPFCSTRWRTFPVSPSWKSFTASASADRNGRNVRLYAWGGSGHTQIRSGRIKITYAILK
jgi:flagellar hook assembly protein FlgD